MTLWMSVVPPVGDRDEGIWPYFLDLLDTNPEEAFRQFYLLAVALFSHRPPVPLRSLSPEDRQDLLHDLILHCVKNDFRVLRQYVPKGKSFAGWLYMVFTNKCRDRLRTPEMRAKRISIHADEDGRSIESKLADPGEPPDAYVENAQVVSAVRRALRDIGTKCRLLLEMAADGLRPKEMVRLLGLADDQNKKVADDLRYCRRRLKERLREMGFEPEAA